MSNGQFAYIKDNLQKVLDTLKESELKANRKEGSVKLCAVSKFHPAEAVLEALECGQHLFGENRVQEACQKFEEVNSLIKDKNLPSPSLHIIGSLQLNKVKKAVEVATCIQSVDREELLLEIEKRCAALEKNIDVFLELHTAEDSKAGFADESSLIKALSLFEQNALSHITVKGLMTMAPLTDNKSDVRASFIRLRNLRERLNKEFPSLPITELSMGMSGDFTEAIEEGATMVRIGTAIFGSRTPL